MKLEAALDEYGLAQRRRSPGEEARLASVALSALREYLLDYAGYADTEEIRPSDLYHFLLEHYPAEETPDAAVALALLEAAAGFGLWLVERGERGLAPFVRSQDRLREDLPRTIEALHLLQEHTRGEEFSGVDVEQDEEEGPSPVGTMSAGVNRIARLDQIDYGSAETDYYRIGRLSESNMALQSEARQALGEGPADPVVLPVEAAKLLRPGDIIQAEIAPAQTGWELLEVLSLRPAGYD